MARNGGSTAVAERAENEVAAPAAQSVSFPQLLAKNEQRLRNLLPDYMSPERYLSLAMLAVNRNPLLRKAAVEAPETIVESVLRAAQCGFEIGGAVPGAHLVPFNNKVKGPDGRDTWRTECQMIPDYRGLINLAVESGAILAGDARVAYAGEHFRVYYGTAERIEHEPDFQAIDAGDIVAVYFVAELPNGKKKFEVMTKKQVDAIRAKSKAKDAMAWSENYAEMAKKTVTKRGLKYVPMSPNNAAARRLALAIEADNRVESGKASAIVPEWDEENIASQQSGYATKERLDSLRDRLQPAEGRDVTPSAEEQQTRLDAARRAFEVALASARPDLAEQDMEAELQLLEFIRNVTGKKRDDLGVSDYRKLVDALNQPREPGSDDE